MWGVLNGRDYLDVTFADGDGSGVDPASIDGDELLLSGAGVGTATLDGTVTLVGGNTYRYGLNPAGEFVAGNVDVTFVGGTWQDNAGNAGVSEIETFTVALTPVGVTTVRVRLTDNNYLSCWKLRCLSGTRARHWTTVGRPVNRVPTTRIRVQNKRSMAIRRLIIRLLWL